MPGNQKPRTRKHRGTQTGSIARSRRSRPRSRQEAMAQARAQRGSGGKKSRQPVDRRDIPPTWRSAIVRGVIIAALLFPISVLLLGEQPAGAAVLSVIAAGLYIPMGYQMESFMYRRRQTKLAQERAQQAQASKNGKRESS
jgi:hypothetical protein